MSEVGDGVLRVLQLNAGTLLEPDWERRLIEVAAWINRLRPDVVCLEEIWSRGDDPSTAHDLVAHLDERWHIGFGGRPFSGPYASEPEVRFGSAILSRWPIDAFRYHRLPVTDAATGAVEHIPWELVHAHTAGLDVFACHLAAAPTDGLHRIAQVLEIDEIIRRVTGTAPGVVAPAQRTRMPPILCGDFNAEPDSDEIRFLSSLTPLAGRTAFYQDAWRVTGNIAPGFTNDWTTHPLAAVLNVHRKRIDYVFVGDPFVRADAAGRVLRAELACHEPMTGIQASDHCGLVVDIVWPERPAG